MNRITRDTAFLLMAHTLSLRSTCKRACQGAIITTEEGRILSLGYNGVPKGTPHCIDIPCSGVNFPSGQGLDKCLAIHAEQNAIARLQEFDKAHTLYTINKPCISCGKLVRATPIKRICYCNNYSGISQLDGLIYDCVPWSVIRDLYFQTTIERVDSHNMVSL